MWQSALLEFQAVLVCVLKHMGKGQRDARSSFTRRKNANEYTQRGQRGMSNSSSIDLKAIDSPEYKSPARTACCL